MNPLQVLKNEERAAADVLDRETGATGAEFPLYDACVSSLACQLPGFAARRPKVKKVTIACSPAVVPTHEIQTQLETERLRWIDRVPCPSGHPS